MGRQPEPAVFTEDRVMGLAREPVRVEVVRWGCEVPRRQTR